MCHEHNHGAVGRFHCSVCCLVCLQRQVQHGSYPECNPGWWGCNWLGSKSVFHPCWGCVCGDCRWHCQYCRIQVRSEGNSCVYVGKRESLQVEDHAKSALYCDGVLNAVLRCTMRWFAKMMSQRMLYFCALLCCSCTVLCCAMLCCSVLCVLCCVSLHSAIQSFLCYATSPYAVQCCSVLCRVFPNNHCPGVGTWLQRWNLILVSETHAAYITYTASQGSWAVSQQLWLP